MSCENKLRIFSQNQILWLVIKRWLFLTVNPTLYFPHDVRDTLNTRLFHVKQFLYYLEFINPLKINGSYQEWLGMQ